MKKQELIKNTIKKIPRGKIFFAESLCAKYISKNVYQVLSLFVKTGDIVRITRGIYVRPKKCRYGFFTPSASEIVKAISKKTGEIISIYSAAAENYVGLSTQIQVNAIYYTTGQSREIKKEGKRSIKLVHISRKKLVMPGTLTCIVVTALRGRGKNLITPLIIKKIHQRLNIDEYSELLKHTDKMPLWMAKKFIQYQNMKSDDPRLEEPEDYY